jgi:acetyl-CoA acetyltransferase
MSQQRTATAQAAGLFDDEIVPISASMSITDKSSGAVSYRNVTLSKDEGNRPETAYEGLAQLKPVVEGGVVTAGSASQLSDGAFACVLMDSRLAEKRGLVPLGRYIEIAVAGNEPEEMGIGPIYAIPKLLKHHGLKVQAPRCAPCSGVDVCRRRHGSRGPVRGSLIGMSVLASRHEH